MSWNLRRPVRAGAPRRLAVRPGTSRQGNGGGLGRVPPRTRRGRTRTRPARVRRPRARRPRALATPLLVPATAPASSWSTLAGVNKVEKRISLFLPHLRWAPHGCQKGACETVGAAGSNSVFTVIHREEKVLVPKGASNVAKGPKAQADRLAMILLGYGGQPGLRGLEQEASTERHALDDRHGFPKPGPAGSTTASRGPPRAFSLAFLIEGERAAIACGSTRSEKVISEPPPRGRTPTRTPRATDTAERRSTLSRPAPRPRFGLVARRGDGFRPEGGGLVQGQDHRELHGSRRAGGALAPRKGPRSTRVTMTTRGRRCW